MFLLSVYRFEIFLYWTVQVHSFLHLSTVTWWLDKMRFEVFLLMSRRLLLFRCCSLTFFHLRMIHSLNRKVNHYSGSVFSWDHFNSHSAIVANSVTYWISEWSLFVDGESWGVDEEVISRLVEDAIDSESREVHTMSRSRSVSTTWHLIWFCNWARNFHCECCFQRALKLQAPLVQKVDNYMNSQELCYTAYAEQPFAFSFFF